jgi:hypothetical protein
LRGRGCCWKYAQNGLIQRRQKLCWYRGHCGSGHEFEASCLTHSDTRHQPCKPLDTEEARITADTALRNYHLPGAHDLRILALFNSRLRHPSLYHVLANDLAFEHKQDRARRGPNVITQRLSQHLIVDYELLTSHQIDLCHAFWARILLIQTFCQYHNEQRTPVRRPSHYGHN